jgi:uncharacterized membrane protein YdjX (TVP38/TMEM64 family)
MAQDRGKCWLLRILLCILRFQIVLTMFWIVQELFVLASEEELRSWIQYAGFIWLMMWTVPSYIKTQWSIIVKDFLIN